MRTPKLREFGGKEGEKPWDQEGREREGEKSKETKCISKLRRNEVEQARKSSKNGTIG